MIVLIHQAEKKENSSSKSMKWVSGVFAMLFWWLIEILFTVTLHFISTEIPDDPQTNDELYFFSTFFNQGTNL